MEPNLSGIFSQFTAEGTFAEGGPYGSGHIHDTFRVITAENAKDDYILQRLNNRVFKNIPELQHNIERVTAHLNLKYRAIPGSDVKRECLTLIPAKNGQSWIVDDNGAFWRMYIFISNHRSYNIVDSPGKAFEGGKAIGNFQAMLADLPGDPLHDTIPFFHNIEKRLETFYQVVKADPVNRVEKAGKEIEFVNQRADEMKIILQLGREG